MRIFRRTLLFVIAVVLVTASLDFFLSQPSVMNILITQAKREKCDTLIVGQSHGECGISPYVIEEELGGSAMNCARRLTPVNNIYYIIKDCNESSSLKRVIFEIDYAYWNSANVDVGEDTNGLYYLSPSLKFEYFCKELLRQNFSAAIFDYNFNAESVKRIPKTVKTRLNSDYIKKNDDAIKYINKLLGVGAHFDYIGKGFRKGKDRIYNEKSYKTTLFKKNKVDEHCLESFKKTVEYCKENDIELVCVNCAVSPYRIKTGNFYKIKEYFSKLCSDNGVKYLDMNFASQQYLPRSEKDYVDVDGHVMGDMADRQTKLICDILKNINNKDKYFYENYNEVVDSFK